MDDGFGSMSVLHANAYRVLCPSATTTDFHNLYGLLLACLHIYTMQPPCPIAGLFKIHKLVVSITTRSWSQSLILAQAVSQPLTSPASMPDFSLSTISQLWQQHSEGNLLLKLLRVTWLRVGLPPTPPSSTDIDILYSRIIVSLTPVVP